MDPVNAPFPVGFKKATEEIIESKDSHKIGMRCSATMRLVGECDGCTFTQNDNWLSFSPFHFDQRKQTLRRSTGDSWRNL